MKIKFNSTYFYLTTIYLLIVCHYYCFRELQEVHHGLKITVGGVHKEMKDRCDALSNKIGVVDEVVKQLNTLKQVISIYYL